MLYLINCKNLKVSSDMEYLIVEIYLLKQFDVRILNHYPVARIRLSEPGDNS